MFRPAERPAPRRFRFSERSAFLIPLIALCLSIRCVQAQETEPRINLDGTPEKPARSSFMAEAGFGYSVGSDLGWQPQLGGYLDLPDSWQAGIRGRLSSQQGRDWYDLFPPISLEARKLWLGDEGADPIRNCEYFSVSVGGFLAYGFAGDRIGMRPIGSLAIGKYWMPFDDQPYGLDISVELSRCFGGHILGTSELVFGTVGLALFYALP